MTKSAAIFVIFSILIFPVFPVKHIFAQRNASSKAKLINPKTNPSPKKRPLTEEEIKALLVPRELTMTVTVKGNGSYPASAIETVTWSVDRTYTATALLNDVIVMPAIPDDVDEWYRDTEREKKGELSSWKYLHWMNDRDGTEGKMITTKISVKDTHTRTLTQMLPGKRKDDKPWVTTYTDTAECCSDALTINGAFVKIDPKSKQISIGIPGAFNTHGGGFGKRTVTETGKISPPHDPPPKESFISAPPPFLKTDLMDSLNSLTLPIKLEDIPKLRKNFVFDTGEMESENDFLGYAGAEGKTKMKVRVVFTLN